jgi:hypothetical protein
MVNSFAFPIDWPTVASVIAGYSKKTLTDCRKSVDKLSGWIVTVDASGRQS